MGLIAISLVNGNIEELNNMHLKFQTLSLNDSVTSSLESKIEPSEQQIYEDVLHLWREEPITEDFSLAQLYERLLQRNSGWLLNEDTLVKTLDHQNVNTNDEELLENCIASVEFPDISSFELKMSDNVFIKVCENDGHKGRGLYAKKDIAKDKLIFKESHTFPIVPAMERINIMHMGKACSLCGNLLSHLSQHFILTNCLDCDNCSAIWCSKQCQKMDITHTVLKHQHLKAKYSDVNANEWSKFENFCKENVLDAAYAVGVIIAATLLNQSERKSILEQFHLLATISETNATSGMDYEHGEQIFDTFNGGIPAIYRTAIGKESFELFQAAFPKLENTDYDTYLSYVSIFNINQVSGQLFFLYSFVNHDCEPNIRFEVESNKEIKAYSRKPIMAGQEILSTYINPLHGVNLRRRELMMNYGFLCRCVRCKKELKRQYSNKITKNSVEATPNILLNVSSSEGKTLSRRKSSMRAARPDLTELLKNGKEFDLEIPELVGGRKPRSASVRFDNHVTLALEE